MNPIVKSAAALTILMSASASPALAQTYDRWSGFYFGGHNGGAWTNIDASINNASYWNEIPGQDVGRDDSGLFGGGHIGLQQQFSRWVAGVEVSFSGGDFGGRHHNDFTPSTGLLPQADTSSVDIHNIFTATARLGYTFDSWMIYAKGGYAGANIRANFDDSVPGAFNSASSRDWHNGWTVGAGIEYQLVQDVIVGVEYNYLDLSSDDHSFWQMQNSGRINNQTPVADMSADMHTVTARISFKLGRRDVAPVSEPMK
ncbi:MAG: outer membrane protein [Hyphomicrobiaceae bacterium]